MTKRIIAFDNHGNWVDVSDGLTVMSVAGEDYENAIEELKWRHPSVSWRRGSAISTAESYDQDGEVEQITVLDYVSQRDIVLKVASAIWTQP